MPIYEYQCSHCGNHLEEMQKVSDPALTTCPKCGKPDLQRVISHTSFQLKGGGYYATDYKKPVTELKNENKEPTAAADKKSAEKKADG